MDGSTRYISGSEEVLPGGMIFFEKTKNPAQMRGFEKNEINVN